MKSDYQTLRVEKHGDHVLIVSLNRPEVANALNTQMGRDLLALGAGRNVVHDDYSSLSDHSPLKTGLRFSLKARMPSSRSLVGIRRLYASISNSRAFFRSICRP